MGFQFKLEDYLTIAEAGAILDRRHSTVWGWINTGRMKAERIGNQWLINPDEFWIPKAKPPGRPRKSA